MMHTFSFSQTSLQDFVECPQRFYLRYVLQLAWPAIQAEPPEAYEEHLQRGQDFHRLVHQHLLGVPSDQLMEMAARDPHLEQWWRAYFAYRPWDRSGQKFPELTLYATVAGRRILAKYDLLIVRPKERVTIYDWKTNLRYPGREQLTSRLQTRVYRYLLLEAGKNLNAGQPWRPQQIEMVYWFPAFPETPVRLPYHEAQYQRDRAYLTSLITRIEQMKASDFIRTSEERRCRFCPYRSYCERGSLAGALSEAEEDPLTSADLLTVDVDFEQIAEVEF